MTLAIIIPVFNEARCLPGLLQHLQTIRHPGDEIIIVDGGSDDGSAALASSAGFTLLQATRGRGQQMNAGAAIARGDILLFLHADCRLPPAARQRIHQRLANGRHVWGRFNVRISGRTFMLRVVAAAMNLRSRLTGIATGDQAIFMTRAAFARSGGFPDQPLMEDIEISRRLLRQSRPACITAPLITSGRRWESHGVWPTIMLMWRLRWAYWRGVPASRLAQDYR